MELLAKYSRAARRVAVVFVTLTALFSAEGCILVGAVAAGAYASSIADEDRKAFHANNIEREKAGLAPLTKDEWLSKKKAEEPAEAKPATESRDAG